jgi:D-beta-D-heptose 7-phosphate kinase/D-beta-D-heptose 1-phosphate adenosyltransferase
LEALRVVDMVIPFEEDTPLELIRNLNPQVLVKGGDYLPTDVVGADFIKKNGGEIVIVPLIPNQSTTQILKSISEKDQ